MLPPLSKHPPTENWDRVTSFLNFVGGSTPQQKGGGGGGGGVAHYTNVFKEATFPETCPFLSGIGPDDGRQIF